MPFGLAPNCWNVVPSTFLWSHETSVQVPTSCALGDFCSLRALCGITLQIIMAMLKMPTILVRFIWICPGTQQTSICRRAIPHMSHKPTFCDNDRDQNDFCFGPEQRKFMSAPMIGGSAGSVLSGQAIAASPP